MSSVRLSEIPRTISFRTGLLFLGLFGCSFLTLFGYIYWQTAFYLKTEADTALYRQVENRSAQPPELRLHEIRKHVAQDTEARLPHSLFDAQGHFIAGAIHQLPPYTALDKPEEFRWLKTNTHHRPVRFIVHRLDDDTLLMVAQDMHDIREFDELLINALIFGGMGLLLVGLVGAVALGYLAHRRLDKVSRSIECIVEGDLTGRLPVRGNNDDIDRLARVVNGMLDELERLMSEVKGVCDDIAHDLRTPLTRLIAGLERAQRRDMAPENYAASVNAAMKEAKGLLLTFSALLRISEIENSARRSHFAQVDLNLIAADAAELYEPLAEEHGTILTIENSQTPVVIPGDAQLLFDALCNLLDNAIKFSPDHSQVRLSVDADTSGVRIQVTDNGPGIPEVERQAVLRRLYRAEASRHTPGNGLGLSMVAAVARLHDLQLTVSDAGPGCRVELLGRPETDRYFVFGRNI
ncbi:MULTISPECIES: sensor histidine kinase [Pseudomonas syringae group]|uniref:histidine kinase n=2 Tax=Pseudomonas syringae group TaxID=136849 RepID=A0A0P9NVN0_PSESX|nr:MULTISPECIES: ATP-binding protein [Pseudomonas syringae group]MDU8432829.1 ATP-binding protein [Pseudomonas syringae pv. actinidifoliorum]KPW89253.1 Integral membrane sensor signal transduction histidine kinase [Pseudomonas syringae pv. castaneae]KWS94011.1 histidine kinase [Pseudomonas syringae pv. castaneae]MDU8524042.1 ATP-binding protein [Pseudomonas syringae pv. actinidifoliorum]MDU8529821.1 ATP-binding protein [Pseudomonas syringae pv. actinidifoliorum]